MPQNRNLCIDWLNYSLERRPLQASIFNFTKKNIFLRYVFKLQLITNVYRINVTILTAFNSRGRHESFKS